MSRRNLKEEEGDVALYDPVPADVALFGKPSFWDERLRPESLEMPKPAAVARRP